MESSELQKRAINLGNKLARELDLDARADTLAHWMAYYIGQQMAIAKKAKGDTKFRAEKECFETILKLWDHRATLPSGSRPFEKFEPIFHTLERLNPENEASFFYSEDNQLGKTSDEVKTWLNIARAIDEAARVWLENVFQVAALSATDEETIEWLENAVSSHQFDDRAIIVRLVDSKLKDDLDEVEKQKLQAKRENLESRIHQLDNFVRFSQDLRAIFVAELESIPEDNSSIENDTTSNDGS